MKNRYQILTALMLLFASAAAPTLQAADPTYSEDIAPILFDHCVSCHRSGEIAPFELLTYEDAANRAQMIKAVTQSRYMPPWKAEPGYGEFAYNASLSQEEIDLIAAWVDAGMPPGDLNMTPAPPTFTDGSQLGVPDLILSMEEAWQIKDNYRDEYRNFVLPTGLTEDRVVAAIEFRPGNPKVVHHAIVYADETGTARQLDADDPGYGYDNFGGPGVSEAKFFEGYVPGRKVDFFPQGMGMILKKGTDLILNLHYAPSVTEEEDKSYVNIFFADERPQDTRQVYQEFVMSPFFIENGPFIIPPNEISTFTGRLTIPADVSVMGIAPHQHLLGRSVKAYVLRPDGETIPLISVPDWDFNWQGAYRFKKLVHIPAGSDLVYEATYDNTVDNPANPNSPPRTAAWGERTSDEMFLCSFQWVDYQAGDEFIKLEQDGTSTSAGETDDENIYHVKLHPNPSSGAAQISFTLAQSATVTVEISDIRGAILQYPLLNTTLAAGDHSAVIKGEHLAPGTYYCRFRTGEDSFGTRMLIVR